MKPEQYSGERETYDKEHAMFEENIKNVAEMAHRGGMSEGDIEKLITKMRTGGLSPEALERMMNDAHVAAKHEEASRERGKMHLVKKENRPEENGGE